MLDLGIAQQFHAGDLEALRVIVEQYQTRIFRLGVRLMGSPETAADFCQEAFVHAFEQRRHYNPQRPFEPWFIRVAVNLGRQWLRRKHEYLSAEELPEVPVPAEAEHSLLQAEQNREVAQALQKVPVVFREVLALRFEGDLSLKEIARVMGSSVGTVKSRLSRGLVAFARAYRAEGGEDK